MATPSTIAIALLTYFLVDTKPTVTNAKSTNAHNSGMPMYMTTLVYHGKNKKVNEPKNNPFAVLDVIAADKALVA